MSESDVEETNIKLETPNPLPPTTAPTPPVIEAKKEEGPKPKYASRDIVMVGYDDCGGCVTTEKFMNDELIPNSDVPTTFKKIIADSPEGKEIVEKKNLKVVPYLEVCLIPTNPEDKPVCTEYKKFKKGDFKLKVNS